MGSRGDSGDVASLDDQGFAAWLAGRAGEALIELRASFGFDDPKALKDAGDKLSHDVLLSELARWRAADAVMSEEEGGSRQAWAGGERPARLDADRVWIVDPLDGTREFSEAGRDDWAVHVALWDRSAGPHGGLVVPGRRPAGTRPGARYRPPRPAATDGPIRIAVSRTGRPRSSPSCSPDLAASALPMGSAGSRCAPW